MKIKNRILRKMNNESVRNQQGREGLVRTVSSTVSSLNENQWEKEFLEETCGKQCQKLLRSETFKQLDQM